MERESRSRATQTAGQIATEFCKETSFHGVKYFVKEDLHAVKRLFWVLCWLVSLGACCYYIYTNLMEYQSSPILTTIDTTTYPITKFKFPSITLCNFNHIMKNRFPPEQEDVIGKRKYPDALWDNLTYRLRHNLFSDEIGDELYNRSHLKLIDPHAYCTIKEGAQSCDDMIIACLWRSTGDCKSLFVQIPTHFGFCCVINVKGRSKSPVSLTPCPKDKSRMNSASNTQLTQTSTGVNKGLQVLLDAQIFLQESRTPPGLNNEGIVVSPGNEVFIPVRASSTYTTAAALGLQPSARRCFTDNEKRLLHYPNYYSYEACKNNFIAEKMVSHCQCRDYHMPGTFENSYAFEDYLHKNCFPRCNTTSYTTAPTYGAMLRSQIQDPFVGPKHLVPLIKKLCDRSSSDVEIQSTGTHYKKNVNATPSQIVGNIGGLMGLFLGFSLLSGAEVVFYLLEIAFSWVAACLGRGHVKPNVT
nr:pickpocket protein 28-like [Penaeus vannamei]